MFSALHQLEKGRARPARSSTSACSDIEAKGVQEASLPLARGRIACRLPVRVVFRRRKYDKKRGIRASRDQPSGKSRNNDRTSQLARRGGQKDAFPSCERQRKRLETAKNRRGGGARRMIAKKTRDPGFLSPGKKRVRFSSRRSIREPSGGACIRKERMP